MVAVPLLSNKMPVSLLPYDMQCSIKAFPSAPLSKTIPCSPLLYVFDRLIIVVQLLSA
ncbi:hypothetical protein ALNOE001_05460 [Candidatus Methanobinarius endosymbioticus]|uniref:Uncharacterized protein n=1 Tax=Candidatus Methanobinarius endosymbioticus TaxID=2006182 RepID=A0A366MCM9_9EURY|nr:hypothetical protein ALNOE001_05460 [Candidatus Methanobinarius endosymbioticus]